MSRRAVAVGDATDHNGKVILLDGIPVALEGHRTECGCVLVGSVNFRIG